MSKKLELVKNGFFKTTVAESKTKLTRVAAPIRLRALGRRENGDTVAQIRFKTMHGGYETEFFVMSDLLRENRQRVKERLAERGYDWPEGEVAQRILDAVAKTRPARRFRLVSAPGWYCSETMYVVRDRTFSRAKCEEVFIDSNTDAHLAAFLVCGSLEGWRELVAKPSRTSCRLRLAIAAAFAAPLLRPLQLDSFGVNLFGDTSDGKTTALRVAASVPGLIGDDGGLPCWADSTPGIEALARGHRDCVMPLDETADGEGTMPLEKKARMMTFLISRNRARKLSRIYERNHNLGNKEFRVLALSTSELARPLRVSCARHQSHKLRVGLGNFTSVHLGKFEPALTPPTSPHLSCLHGIIARRSRPNAIVLQLPRGAPELGWQAFIPAARGRRAARSLFQAN
jgi:putative DNA primase/helicase